MTDFDPQWVRELRFHIRRADGVVGPVSRAEVDQGLSSGRFHEEMPASVDMGSTWHPLRQHLGIPDPAPQPLPPSLENPIPPTEPVPAAINIPAPEIRPGFFIRQWDKWVAITVGLAQGFVPVAVPVAGGAAYLLAGHDANRARHEKIMAEYSAMEGDAIEPAQIENAADPALWKTTTRPYIAIEGVVQAQHLARQRIPPETILRLKPIDPPPTLDTLKAKRAAGMEWIRSDQSEPLIAAAQREQASISPVERVEDLKPDPATRYLRRQAVEKSVRSAWDSVLKARQDDIDAQRKKMAQGTQALSRVVDATRDPAVRQLFPGLDALCENPPAPADLPAALARIRAAGQKQPANP